MQKHRPEEHGPARGNAHTWSCCQDKCVICGDSIWTRSDTALAGGNRQIPGAPGSLAQGPLYFQYLTEVESPSLPPKLWSLCSRPPGRVSKSAEGGINYLTLSRIRIGPSQSQGQVRQCGEPPPLSAGQTPPYVSGFRRDPSKQLVSCPWGAQSHSVRHRH